MKKIVERDRNKTYYRILHLPIWIWVFFILPGHLAYDLFTHGPDRRHALWLAVVTAFCVWRGMKGRLPGVEEKPYITYFGVDSRNLPYRVVCYTAAWIDLLVPYLLNAAGLVIASLTGNWILKDLYFWLYYPLALMIVAAGFLNWIPRARRSTMNEGAERAWFYVSIWTVVLAQIGSWGAWRLGGQMGLEKIELARLRLLVFLIITGFLSILGMMGRLPRTSRYYHDQDVPFNAEEMAE